MRRCGSAPSNARDRRRALEAAPDWAADGVERALRPDRWARFNHGQGNDRSCGDPVFVVFQRRQPFRLSGGWHEGWPTPFLNAAGVAPGPADCGTGCLGPELPIVRCAGSGDGSAAKALRESSAKQCQVFRNGRSLGTGKRPDLASQGHKRGRSTLEAKEPAEERPFAGCGRDR